jgi:MFS family permease
MDSSTDRVNRQTGSEPSALRDPLFRALWLVALAANVGTWMQNVAAAWLMTTLTASPVDVALVQTATTLPVFLVAIPSGALADLVDRRWLLLLMQSWMCVSAAVLGVLTLGGTVTPWSLLGFTFALGLGAAMSGPAWQALIPEIVSRQQLPSAIALNSAQLSMARAIGPALGGLVVTAIGAGGGFVLNAVSFLGVIVFVYRWRPPPRTQTAPGENLLGAMRAGTRYARHDPALRAVLVRSGAALLFAAAIWALLPLLARDRLGVGSLGYGLLLGCFGMGAVTGAGVRLVVGNRIGADATVNAATLVFAVMVAFTAVTSSVKVALPLLFVAGIAWTSLISSFTTVAQLAAPGWAKARALAAYLLVAQGGLAAGSTLWGLLAQRTTIEVTLLVTSACLAATVLLTRRFALARGESVDLTLSLHWPEPQIALKPDPHDGPVLVSIAYRIPPESADRFVDIMDEVRQRRFRDGALSWGLYQDLADETTFVEGFLVDSWAEHLRQHARVTVDDQDLERRARAFHQGPNPPVVSHLIDSAARRSARR